MATTSSLKSNAHQPQSFSWKLLAAFVMWIVLTLGLIAAVYVQSAQNSYQINSLMSEMKLRRDAEYGFTESIKSLDSIWRKEHQEEKRITAGKIDRLQTDLNNYQDFMKRSLERQDELASQLNRLSERLDNKDKELNEQSALQSIQKQVEQIKDSFHSYMKSQDFFQVVKNMMDVYSKKFNQIYQELDEKDEFIQKLSEASQTKIDLQPQEPIMKRENIETPKVSSQHEGSFINQVEADIEDLKDRISHSVEETLEKMKDFTTSTQEKIVNNAGDSINKVKELAQTTREKLNTLIGTPNQSPFEKVKEFAKSTGENFGVIKDFVVINAGQSAERLKEISKTASEKIEPIKEAVSEQAQQVKESVLKIGKDLGEKTKGIAEKAKNFAKKFF